MFLRTCLKRKLGIGIVLSKVGLDLIKDDIEISIIRAEIIPPHFNPEHVVIIC